MIFIAASVVCANWGLSWTDRYTISGWCIVLHLTAYTIKSELYGGYGKTYFLLRKYVSVTTQHTNYWYTHAIRSMLFCHYFWGWAIYFTRLGRVGYFVTVKPMGLKPPPTHPLLSQVHDWLLSPCCHTDWERHWQLVMLIFVYTLRLAVCACVCDLGRVGGMR